MGKEPITLSMELAKTKTKNGISVAKSQTFLGAKRPQRRRARRNGSFRRLNNLCTAVKFTLKLQKA